jgi:hypothetical protein
MIELDFRMDGGVGLQIATADIRAADFFRGEYGWARADRAQNEAPSVILDWRRSTLPELDPASGHYHRHKLLARWRYRIAISEDQVRLTASGNRMALPMVHHMMVHPSLRWLASRRERILLHGSALVHDGRSVIFTGAGGAGKTTTSSILLAKGDARWRLHSDDYTFITVDARTEAYLTRAHLYRDLLGWVPAVADRLSSTQRLKLELFGRLRRWSGERIKWPVRLPLEALWPNRQPEAEAELAGVFLLVRTGTKQPEVTRLENEKEVIDGLIGMNFGEAKHFLKLLRRAHPGAEVGRLVEEWHSHERAVLQSVWRSAPFFRLALPRAAASGLPMAARLEAALLSAIEAGGR